MLRFVARVLIARQHDYAEPVLSRYHNCSLRRAVRRAWEKPDSSRRRTAASSIGDHRVPFTRCCGRLVQVSRVSKDNLTETENSTAGNVIIDGPAERVPLMRSGIADLRPRVFHLPAATVSRLELYRGEGPNRNRRDDAGHSTPPTE